MVECPVYCSPVVSGMIGQLKENQLRQWDGRLNKFSEFANAQVFDLKLDITNLNMLFHNGLLSETEETL